MSAPALEPFADAAVGVLVGVVDEAGVDPEQDLDAVSGALGDGLRCDAGAELSGEPGGPQAAGVLGEVGVEQVERQHGPARPLPDLAVPGVLEQPIPIGAEQPRRPARIRTPRCASGA